MKGEDKGKEAETDPTQGQFVPPLVPIDSRGLLPLPHRPGEGKTTHI